MLIINPNSDPTIFLTLYQEHNSKGWKFEIENEEIERIKQRARTVKHLKMSLSRMSINFYAKIVVLGWWK